MKTALMVLGNESRRLRFTLRTISRGLAVLVIANAVIVLVGWALDMASLTTFLTIGVPMNPLTAILFLVMGAAVLLFAVESPAPDARHLPVKLLAGAVALVSLAKVLEYGYGWSFGLDRRLFADKLGTNQMAPNTALLFLITASSLLLWDGKSRRPYLAQGFAVLAHMIAVLSCMGYAYSYHALYRIQWFIPMALNTAVGFLLLTLAALFSRPESGFPALLTRDNLSGALVRRSVPAVMAFMPLLGWLRLEGRRQNLYDEEFGIALYTIVVIVVLLGLLLGVGKSLERLENAAQEARDGLKKANRELRRRAILLEAANKELDAFCHSVSHDLRAPLRGIDGFGQALLEDYGPTLDPTAQGYVGRIRAATQTMGQLIDDMLALSRVTRSEMRRETVDLGAIARKIAAALKRENPERRATFDIAPGLFAEGDPGLLEIVMDNLLRNAWKFTSKKPEALIEVGSRPTAIGDIYFVRDNGAGFDPAYAHKLFGVFQRLHTVEEFPGTGVGLATVQRIVHRHGGAVWAEGRPGEGATLSFTLNGAPPPDENITTGERT